MREELQEYHRLLKLSLDSKTSYKERKKAYVLLAKERKRLHANGISTVLSRPTEKEKQEGEVT